jgi:hypothetical protein
VRAAQSPIMSAGWTASRSVGYIRVLYGLHVKAEI